MYDREKPDTRSEEKVLLVDDEPRVLLALHRSLGDEFNISLATTTEEAFNELSRSRFAVIVSDYRMPGMDGVEFLARVRESYPDTVRVMLTGQGNLDAAMNAINDGHVFRFLTKPCATGTLAKVLTAALEQYRLITAERQVVQETLMGTITVLTEMLSIVFPAAFSRSFRIRHYVMLLAKAFGLGSTWQLSAAGVLSQIGCITLPLPAPGSGPDAEPADYDPEAFSRHPAAGAALLREIPRLEGVARMIALQQKPYREYADAADGVEDHVITLGGQILKVATDLERLVRRGDSFSEALAKMNACEGEYNPDLLAALEDAGEATGRWIPAEVNAAHLSVAMVLGQDVTARNGLVLARKGEEVTYPLLERLRSFAKTIGVVEPIAVLIPEEGTPEAARPERVNGNAAVITLPV